MLKYSELLDNSDLKRDIVRNQYKYTTGKITPPPKSKTSDPVEIEKRKAFSKRSMLIKKLLSMPESLKETYNSIKMLAVSVDTDDVIYDDNPLMGITHEKITTATPDSPGLKSMDFKHPVETVVSIGPQDAKTTTLELLASTGNFINYSQLKAALDLGLANQNIIIDLLTIYDWRQSLDFAVLESIIELSDASKYLSEDTKMDKERFLYAWKNLIDDHLLKNYSNFEAAVKTADVSLNNSQKIKTVAQNLGFYNGILRKSQNAQCGYDKHRPGNYILKFDGKSVSKCPEQLLEVKYSIKFNNQI